MLINLLINVIHKKNICAELLSRAKILPAIYLNNSKIKSENLFNDLFNNFEISNNNLSTFDQGYLETTNYILGIDNKIHTSIGKIEKYNE